MEYIIPDKIVAVVNSETSVVSDHSLTSVDEDDYSSFKSVTSIYESDIDDVKSEIGNVKSTIGEVKPKIGDETARQYQSLSSYTALISELTKTLPNSGQRHFESLAKALYCRECRMVLKPKYAARMQCKVPKFEVRQDGTVVCVHTKCEKLDVARYVRSAASQHGNWSDTYWRLWSGCHYLSCATCKWPYLVRNSAMCRYHPGKPEYFSIEKQNLEQPIGRYSCCGEIAFRFEVVKHPSGCKYRPHVPNVKNERDVRIEAIARKCPKSVIAEPPSRSSEKKIKEIVNSDIGMKIPNYQHWWTKMTLGAESTVYRSINFNGATKEQKNSKYLKKKLKKKARELRKRTKHNRTKNSYERKEIENHHIPFMEDEFEVSSFPTDSESLLPLDFEDMQSAQEAVYFKTIKENCSSKTLEPPGGTYTAVLEKFVTKIEEYKKDPSHRNLHISERISKFENLINDNLKKI